MRSAQVQVSDSKGGPVLGPARAANRWTWRRPGRSGGQAVLMLQLLSPDVWKRLPQWRGLFVLGGEW